MNVCLGKHEAKAIYWQESSFIVTHSFESVIIGFKWIYNLIIDFKFNFLIILVKTEYNLKVGWYSGRSHLAPEIDLQYFDYVKLGPYIEERGGLDNPNTNQVMLEIDNTCGGPITKDITSYFWRKSN